MVYILYLYLYKYIYIGITHKNSPGRAFFPQNVWWQLVLERSVTFGGFHSHRGTIAGWFLSWKIPIENGWFRGTPTLEKASIYIHTHLFKLWSHAVKSPWFEIAQKKPWKHLNGHWTNPQRSGTGPLDYAHHFWMEVCRNFSAAGQQPCPSFGALICISGSLVKWTGNDLKIRWFEDTLDRRGITAFV